MPTPSEAFLAEYRALCERYGLCITSTYPDKFSVVPLDEDSYPGLHIFTYEEELESQRQQQRAEVRRGMERIISLHWDPYLNCWKARSDIVELVTGQAKLWPEWQRRIMEDDPTMLTTLLDHYEKQRPAHAARGR